MRKIRHEAICALPNLPGHLALSAKRLAAKEAALDAARKELDAEKERFFTMLIEGWGYDDLKKAGVL
jgi:hypothetical protein